MKKSVTNNYHSKAHKLLKLTIFTCFCLLTLHSSAHAWAVSATWESLANGSTACDGNTGSGEGLTDGCYDGRYTVSNTYAHSGTKSMRIYVKKGDANTGQPHFALPSPIYDGGEFWGRYYLYVPSGFDWTSEYITKLFRLVQSDSGGSGVGYVSILETKPGVYGCSGSDNWGYIVGGSEYTQGYYKWGGSYVCQTHGTVHFLTTGSWHQLELYVKASSSGTGTFRIWHNGTLIWEKTNIQTIPSGGWLGDASKTWSVNHFMGWWNQGGAVPTKDEYLYVDDFVYTNERPSNRDTYGNYMIGPIGSSGGTPSPAPSPAPSPLQPSPPSTIRIN